MKCPNCMFEVQGGPVQCPFCSFMLPLPGAASEVPVPGMEAVPTPEPQPIPDSEPIEIQGDLPPHELPEPGPLPDPGPAKSAGAMKLAAIAGAGLLAFQLGLLDNLLLAVGLKSPPAPPPAPAPPPPQAPVETQPAPAPVLFAEPAAPDAGSPIAPAVPAPPAAKEWSFEGRIYDMVSLKPVKGVVLLFMTQNEEETFEAKCDEKGRYKVSVPARAGGYKVVADHPDYIDGYFDETEPPFKSWTMEKRRQLRSAKPANAAWKADDGAPKRRDLVLFPDITDR